MKLFNLLLLAITAVAATVPAALKNIPDAAGNTALLWSTIGTGSTAKQIGYRQFGLDVAEYCKGSNLKARAYWTDTDNSGGQKISFTDSNMFTGINLGYNVALRIGPYDFSRNTVGLHYGSCDWEQDINGAGDCGICNSYAWSSENLDCTKNAASERTHHIDCWVGVAEIDSASQDALAARDEPARVEPARVVPAQASKTTISPEVLVRPTGLLYRPVILPFHFTITEYCTGPKKYVRGIYSNGLVVNMNLNPTMTNNLNHTITEYPDLTIGPYATDKSRLRFYYKSAERNIECEWFDDETWKRCGECRAGLWSGEMLNCGKGGSRTKEMDCSFIMGYGDLGS